MRSLFHPDAGELLMDADACAVFTNWLGGADVAADDLAVFRASGAMRGNDPHPAIEAALTAFVEPSAQLQVCRGATIDAAVFLDASAAVILSDRPDGWSELRATHPTLVPGELARRIRLAPRALPADQAIRVPTFSLDAMFAEDRETRGATVSQLTNDRIDQAALAALRSLASGMRNVWSLDSAWRCSRGQSERRSLSLVETTTGYWRREGGAQIDTLCPLSAEQVWYELVRLVPRTPLT